MLCVLVVIVSVIGGGVRPESVFIPLLALAVLATFVSSSDATTFRRDLLAFLLVLTVLTLLYVWNDWGGRLTDFLGDGNLWLRAAQEIIAGGFLLVSPEHHTLPVTHIGVAYIYAGVLILGLGNVYSLIVFHALIIALSAHLMDKVARRVFDGRAAKLVYWMTALHPEVLAWSSVLIRESLNLFLIILFFYACVRFFVDGSHIHGVYLVGTLALTYFVRASMVFALVAIVFVCVALLMGKPRRFMIRAVTCASIVAISIWLTVIPLTSDPRVRRIGQVLSSGVEGGLVAEKIEFEEVSIVRDLLGEKFSATNAYLWPLWVVAYWIYPFPQLGSGTDYMNPVVIVAENLMGVINFLLLPFIILGCLGMIREPDLGRVMVIAGAVIMATAMIFAGPFILGRYRMIVTPFFLLICSYALTNMRFSQRLLVISVMPFVMLGFWGIYGLVKAILAT